MLDEVLDRPWLLGSHSVRIDRKICDGVAIRVVRDDLLHPWAGGNKIRKLDAWLPEMERQGVTDVVTCGGVQSAHATSVAALCAERRMTAHLFLRGEPLEHPTGYNLLSHLFGTVTYVDRDRYATRGFLESEAAALRSPKKSVAVIPEGAGGVLSLYGLVRQVHGIMLSIPDPFSSKIELVVDSGTGTTAAGLALGVALLELPWKVSAICLMEDALESYQSHSRALWALWGEHNDMPGKTPEITWNSRSRPRRFGKVLDGEFEKCRQIAQQTGVLFDPIYTLAAWEAIEHRKSKHREQCVLVHTGGALNLFGVANRYSVSFG